MKIQIEMGKITAVQFLFCVACFLQSSYILISLFVSSAKQDAWIAVIFGFIASLPTIFILIKLMKMYPRMNLIQINDKVFGKVLGKVFSVIYIFFFITLTALNLRDTGNFVQNAIMPKTPLYITIMLFAFVCIYAARNGIATVSRYSVAFAVAAILTIVLSLILTMNIMDFNNFLPMFNQPLIKYVQSTHIILAIPFGEILVFLMIFPAVDAPLKKIGKCFFIGFCIGAVNILITVLWDIAVLGPAITLFALPPFETFRLTALTQALSRMEIFFAVALIFLLFFKVSLLFYVSALAISQITGLKTMRPLLLGLGGICSIYALIVYPSTVVHKEHAGESTAFLWTLFEFVMPLITLVTGLIKNKTKGQLKRSEQPS